MPSRTFDMNFRAGLETRPTKIIVSVLFKLPIYDKISNSKTVIY